MEKLKKSIAFIYFFKNQEFLELLQTFVLKTISFPVSPPSVLTPGDLVEYFR